MEPRGVNISIRAGKDVMIRQEKNKERNEAFSDLPQILFRSKRNSMATHNHGSWRFDA